MLSYEFETTVGWMFWKGFAKFELKNEFYKKQNCWIRYTIFKKYVHDWLLPTCFQVKHESLNCKGQKKCLQNRHKRKHCWALDATVKIADARSLRSEGQMFFFGEKSNLDFAFRPPKAAAYIHRAHLVGKNFEEFCSHLLRWQIRIRKVESRCFLVKLESEFCFPAAKGTLVAYVNSILIGILTEILEVFHCHKILTGKVLKNVK